MKPCYFCQTQLKSPSEPNYRNIFYCHKCANKNNLTHVITTYNNDPPEELIYVHIYMHIKDKEYHIRLNLQEGKTDVMAPRRDPYYLQELDGYPFTPQNANQKLRTILTFL